MPETWHRAPEAAKLRWMTGATGALPDEVRALGLPPDLPAAEAELQALVAVSQLDALCLRPRRPAKLSRREDLPRLAKPPLGEALRRRFRALVAQGGAAAEHVPALIGLIDARGRSVHPADWLPRAAADDLPETYAPWLAWCAGASAGAADAVLDADRWGDLPPARRRLVLRGLRRTDPAAARELLAAHIGGLAAEARLGLVEALAENLGEDDAAFLESLSADRSQKVRALAASLLARLGRGGDAANAARLRDHFEVASEGILRRTRVLRRKATRDGAAMERVRAAILDEVCLADVAAAFGLAPDEALAIWQFGAGMAEGDAAFARMIGRSASDRHVAVLAERLTAEQDGWRLTPLLAGRLGEGTRRAIAGRALAAGPAPDLEGLLAFAGPSLPELTPDRALAYAHFAQLWARPAPTSAADAEAEHKERAHRRAAARSVRLLGLLCPAAAAAALLDRLTRHGWHAADPDLDLLRFNVALDQEATAP